MNEDEVDKKRIVLPSGEDAVPDEEVVTERSKERTQEDQDFVPVTRVAPAGGTEPLAPVMVQ